MIALLKDGEGKGGRYVFLKDEVGLPAKILRIGNLPRNAPGS